MPIRTLIQIKRPTRDRIILIAIFGVGALSCLAAFVCEHFKIPLTLLTYS
jgi:hypothetical protein